MKNFPWIPSFLLDAMRAGSMSGLGRILLAALMALAAVACTRASPAEQAAVRFVDTYYVRIDPKAAVELSTGAAREKLEKELQRLADVGPIDSSDRPQIRAALRDRSVEDNGAVFAYEIQSISDGVSQLTVNVYLAEREGRWLVTDFRESEHE